jgi:hypothetical protein
MMDILPVGPAAQAGAQLHVFGFIRVVTLHPHNAVSFYVQAKWATPSAVKGTGGPHYPNLFIIH